MYKAPLTATVVDDFISSFQTLHRSTSPHDPSVPFVYVDQNGVKLVTNVVDEKSENSDGVFALSVAEDGWMEMLAFFDQQG